MIRLRLAYTDWVIEVETDAELHPDLLDELTAKVKALFLEIQAGLPNGDGDDAAT